MKKNSLLDLFRLKNTVFTFKDVSLIWKESNSDLVKSRINYYVKTGKLRSVRRGIYAKDESYNRFELATKIYTPSYISFETVLRNHGVIFQHYESIFIASYLAREILCDKQKYVFRKIKNSALTNPSGVLNEGNYFIASKERAFLDMIYLYKNYYFDNLNSINWELCFEIAQIYENKSFVKNLNSYYKSAKNV